MSTIPTCNPDSVRMPELLTRDLSKLFPPLPLELTRREMMQHTSTPVAISALTTDQTRVQIFKSIAMSQIHLLPIQAFTFRRIQGTEIRIEVV